MKKKLQALLLLITLTAFQTTEPFSWEWCSDLYTRTTQAISTYFSRFDRDQINQLKGAGTMLGIVGLIGGMYYLNTYFGKQEVHLKKKDLTKCDRTGGISEKARYENSLNGQEIEIQQLAVAQQEGASCGYHAVKNSYAYATAYFGESVELLQDFDIIKNLFGIKGLWRRMVVAQLLDDQLKNDLKRQFTYKRVEEDGALVQIGDRYYRLKPSKISSKYQTLLPSFIAYLANAEGYMTKIGTSDFTKLFSDFLWKNHEEINIDKTMEYLIEPPLVHAGESLFYSIDSKDESDPMKAVLWSHLTSKETINKYLSLNNDIEIEHGTNEVLVKLGEEWHVIKEPSGDWIGNDHIAFLCKNLNRELGENKLPVIIVPDIKDLDRPEDSDVPRKINKFVQLAWGSKEYVQAFILGTMSQLSQSEGHWISVVFEKNSNKHRYTIMDSLNSSGIDSPLVQKLVQNVETKFHTFKE